MTNAASAQRKVVELPRDGAAAQYRDIWTWEDVKEEWMLSLERDHPKTHATIETARGVLDAGRKRNAASLPAYLAFMAIRLVEMHRILKPNGSLFVHCDYTANSYLWALLDSIFGHGGLKAEIVWQRNAGGAKGSQHKARKLGVDTDTIYHYAKSDKYTWNAPRRALSAAEIERKFPRIDSDGRRFNTDSKVFCDPSQGPRPNLCYTYASPYGPVENPHPSGWRVTKDKLAEMDARGEVYWRRRGQPRKKTFADSYPGELIGSLWTDINLGSQSRERTGYPTQKPVALASRIIAAASDPGDLVFDPFAGCAYVPVAAELLARNWLACDISPRAMTVIERQYSKPWQAQLPGVDDQPESLNFNKVNLFGPDDLPLRTDTNPEATSPQPLMPRNYGQQLRMPIPEQKALMAEHSGWACWACGYSTRASNGSVIATADHLHYDHITPKSSGSASDDFYNRALLCAPCNSEKSNRLVSIDALRLEPSVVRRREAYGVSAAELVDHRQVHFAVTQAYVRRYPNSDTDA